MGLFGFFIKRILKGLPRVEAASKGRGRAGPVETRPCGSPVRAPVPVKIETAETNPFATPEAAVRAAFDQVVGGTDIPERTRRDLFRAYSAAHRAGSPRAEEKAMEEYLGEADWRWPWFDEWVQRLIPLPARFPFYPSPNRVSKFCAEKKTLRTSWASRSHPKFFQAFLNGSSPGKSRKSWFNCSRARLSRAS